MYTIYVTFHCKEGKREAFVERVHAEGIVSAVRAENGCVRYEYYYSVQDPNELLLMETWESRRHQQIHVEQPHMERLRSFKNEYIVSTVLSEFELRSPEGK